ncbi:MAG: serine/threonine-protein kinase, partial [Rhodospirillales bacterium]|nr:serine/threonine-protein kinase [Rhodospirillales bacterium]
RPMGGRVFATPGSEIRRIDEYEIIRKFVTPMVLGLKEIFQRGLTHRAIRPTNMFFMEPRDRIVFGDCCVSPPALEQTAIFEPIEMIMCHPTARGNGRSGDDLYALGVSLVMMLLGRNPVSHYDEETVLRQKMSIGTYAVLVGEERLPLAMIEVLRGLLCDDPHERWTMESLDLWLSGRRLSPLQPRLEKRAQRGFQFRGKEYFGARDLGMAFSKFWDEAIPPVMEGRLELWLRRALEDKERAEMVQTVMRNAAVPAADKRVGADQLLARVCIILDPTAPIRYKGLHAMPDGFGPLLAYLMANGRDLRLIAECITREIPKQWFESRSEYNPEYSPLEGNFRELRAFLMSTSTGFGMERCLYELNDSLACQSSLVGADYVVDFRELLSALDNAAKRVDPKTWPIDRHIAAFIACRVNYDVDRQITNLSDPKPEQSTLAMLGLLALMQWRQGNEPLYNLAAWVGGLIQPIVENFHSRQRRKRLDKEIPRNIRQGSLVDMFSLIDNAEEWQKDADGFERAKAQFLSAHHEIKEMESGRVGRDEHAKRIGRQVAALISMLITLCTLTVLTVMRAF